MTESRRNTPRPSGRWMTPAPGGSDTAGSDVVSTPFNLTLPDEAGTNPEIARAMLLLPVPFRPRMARVRPGWIRNDAADTAMACP